MLINAGFKIIDFHFFINPTLKMSSHGYSNSLDPRSDLTTAQEESRLQLLRAPMLLQGSLIDSAPR